MKINFKKHYILFLLLLAVFWLPSAAKAQVLDQSNDFGNRQVIAILPVRAVMADLFSDSLGLLGNQLGNKLRQNRNIETLNVLSSIRRLKNSSARDNYMQLSKDYQLSDFPDPDDLYQIAKVLNADKIILISGGFDTQRSLLRKNIKAHFNIFSKVSINPRYEYTAIFAMFDPVSGEMEWQEVFNHGFSAKNVTNVSNAFGVNPYFLKKFNEFSAKTSEEAKLSLNKYFYTQEISTVSRVI
jgi:hypothetical protein